jgi:miniconductance mechanosensitive channel
MFIKLEEFLINTLGDTTLVHLLCAVVMTAICGLTAFIVKIAMSVILNTLAKKGHHAAVREAAKSAKERKLGGKSAFLIFFYGLQSLSPYLFSAEKIVYVVSGYAMLILVMILISTAVDVFGDVYSKRPIAKKRSIKGILQVVKIFVYIVFGTIAVSLILGQNPLVLISGVSAFAAILAIVFKDPLLGLVAGVQITADDLLRIGDWVTIPSMDVEGSITDISLISVRVTEFDNTVSVVPAYSFLSVPFTNYRQAINGEKRQFRGMLNIDTTSVRSLTAREAAMMINRHKDLFEGKFPEDADLGGVTNLSLYRTYLSECFKASGHIREEYACLVSTGSSEGRGIPVKLLFTTDIGDYNTFVEFSSQVYEQSFAAMPDFELNAFQERNAVRP